MPGSGGDYDFQGVGIDVGSTGALRLGAARAASANMHPFSGLLGVGPSNGGGGVAPFVPILAAKSEPLTKRVLFQQLLFGKIAHLHDTDFLRQLKFEPSSANTSECVFRRRGRPRLSWQSVLHGLAISFAPQGVEHVNELLPGNAPINAGHLIEHF